MSVVDENMDPFRIKVVEEIKMNTMAERVEVMMKANYNLFKIKSEDVTIDLLSDSGTGTMSIQQWKKMLEGDEAYAGSSSFFKFEKTVRDVTGFRFILPTHQGRGAERILFQVFGGKGKIIPNNSHFDTTRANIEFTGATACDLLVDEGYDPEVILPFKGNMDVDKLEALIAKEEGKQSIPLVLTTITNNQGGGQPVSMSNMRAVSRVCRREAIPFFLDCARFAENAYFIKQREDGYRDESIGQICHEMFSLVDGAFMSAKKDGLVNMGGFIGLNNELVAEKLRNFEILWEGFPTYGGLSGRDMEAISQGLKEVISEDYLRYRIDQTKYLGDRLVKLGVPLVLPFGGHAIYINAGKFLPHIPSDQFPGQALGVALYIQGGIRGVEVGSLMVPNAKIQMLRLAIPRRVYTRNHIDHVVEALAQIKDKKDELVGLRILRQPPFLRHFSCNLSPISSDLEFLDVFQVSDGRELHYDDKTKRLNGV